MVDETKTPEEILEHQINEARQSAIKELVKPGSMHTSETGTEGREEKRLKKKYLNELDGLAQRLLELRSFLDDPDGEEAGLLLDRLNNNWVTTCKNFNKRPRARFTLRPEAFMDRAEYYLNLEKEQIKAAKEAYQKSMFDRWFRRNVIDYKWRTRWYKIKSKLVKKSVNELFRAYWDRIPADIIA
ncbi:hypothetical protein LCGC14_0277770 [marine sediment metagenome]|uniref:Uncharacterized protein n=1 Tax=marine sediment metagenome TaxID=412755 RepID=A0A0F9X201_9ZZZZ